MSRLLLLSACCLVGLSLVAAQKDKPNRPTSAATPADTLRVRKDYKVELLYSVPREQHGSWVNLCTDPHGRIITSDQYGPLYRITPPALGAPTKDTKVERLELPLGGAHGLLWAFDSLYVMVNENVKVGGVTPKRGLHRVRSKDGGNTFETPEFLHSVEGVGEHGAHAILLSPDRQSLHIVCGNSTKMVSPLSHSRVPKLWGEDHLLPRLPDGNGFMKNVLGPGGCIYKVDPDGKNWELVSTGFRNEFDAAFNRDGDLFTYDADMEWDMNTPWYRPTRVNLATSGAEFGWRNGAGKWPAYYPDSLPEVVNIGPGSPTGVCFGYGAKFPAKYQDAFYICDWSYGKLYAVHLTPDGSAYKGELEEFVTGLPLPLTDVVVNPKDGALYFAIGGRRTQSGLYRVTYTGKESLEPGKADTRGADQRALRRKLEALHKKADATAVETAWPHLNHEDRYIRFAARVVLEHQEPKLWQQRALDEKQPQAALTALLGLVRATSTDPFHRKDDSPKADAELTRSILAALERLKWEALNDQQRLELLRIYHIFFNRTGRPSEETRRQTIARFDTVFPTKSRPQNVELCNLLVYLEAPSVAAKTLKLMATALTQEEQLDFARALRALKTGWTQAQREEYFSWFEKAQGFRGGSSFKNFLRLILDDALAPLADAEKDAVRQRVAASAAKAVTPATGKMRPFVRTWKLDEAVTALEKGLSRKRDFERGRQLFGEANCFACHRFANDGGALGPDLTGVSGRFSQRDLLESMIDPNKVISDQYAAVTIVTDAGKTVTGRIVNLSNDDIHIMPNMLEPNAQVKVNRKNVESLETSKISQMPTGLLDTLKEDELADLVAYLLSGGNREHKLFR